MTYKPEATDRTNHQERQRPIGGIAKTTDTVETAPNIETIDQGEMKRKKIDTEIETIIGIDIEEIVMIINTKRNIIETIEAEIIEVDVHLVEKEEVVPRENLIELKDRIVKIGIRNM